VGKALASRLQDPCSSSFLPDIDGLRPYCRLPVVGQKKAKKTNQTQKKRAL
jgi:hypothetical protein